MLARVLIILGSSLLGLNIYGTLWPPDYARDYQQIWRFEDTSQSYAWVRHSLRSIDAVSVSPERDITMVVNRRMANPLMHTKTNFATRVHPAENWLLWGLGFFSRYFEEYVFADPIRALRRGLGHCYQQALAVVGLLEQRGIEAGILGLHNHVAVWVRRDGQETIADPDYGVWLPFDVDKARSDPEDVVRLYEDMIERPSNAASAKRVLEKIYDAYSKAPLAARAPRGVAGSLTAWKIRFEEIAYFVKWAVPLLLLAVGLGIVLRRKVWRLMNPALSRDTRLSHLSAGPGRPPTRGCTREMPGTNNATCPPARSAPSPPRERAPCLRG